MLNSKELGALSDRDLLAEARAYEAKLTADAAGLNFSSAQVTSIKNTNDVFETTLDAWDAVQLEEAGLSEAKTNERRAVLDEMRRQRNIAYADTSIDEATLATYGMPPRDKVKTASSAPTTAPMGWVDYGKLKHVIHFRDSATPDKKAKPKGMKGCDIYRCVGTVPTSEDDYRYVANDSESPYTIYYDMADANKKVYYLLRWVSKSGEVGEWSETIEATING